jgi:DnaJ-class molecular chaperone
MKRLNEAKRILSDSTLRERYNITGSTSDTPPPGYGRSSYSSFRGRQGAFYANGRAYYFDPDDFFAQFMGQSFRANAGGGGGFCTHFLCF